MDIDNPSAIKDSGYTVVARRYRPRSFGELIGQDHIAQALGKAITSGRVGHAYLFTGARGVGKTSTARIFAKVLNTPDGTGDDVVAEIASSIDAGEDMDVIEIDGASNRGIEEIRQLRANVNVRPSRSPYKIYIIDEVHMLTSPAFNALLKTLEEPPPHVKFIFCTTDPDKIPITVLSRCQRFDFAPVKLEAIQGRLKEICGLEGFEADDEALALLARRAAGSMRDSQSLLEQVMSFSTDKINVEQVHALLGTADESRLLAFVEALIEGDALAAVSLVDESIRGGSDAGQVAEQLLGYLRDLMAVGIGGGSELLKLANPSGIEKLKSVAESWGVQTILSAIQILDESLVRMRTSVSSVTLLEVALVQICHLEGLASIPELLERLSLAGPGGGLGTGAGQAAKRVTQAEKKKSDLATPDAASEVGSATNVDTSGSKPSDVEASGNHVSPAKHTGVGSSAVSAVGRTPSSKTAGNASPANPNRSSAASGSAGSASPVAASLATEDSANDVSAASPLPANRPGAEADAGRSNARAATGSDADAVNRLAPMVKHGEPNVATPRNASAEALAKWRSALKTLNGMLADFAGMAQAVEPVGSDEWRILFPPGANHPREYCEQAERRAELQDLLRTQLDRDVRLTFALIPGQVAKPKAAVPQSTLRAQKLREMSDHPYVKKLCEVLGGEIVRVDPPRPTAGAPNSEGPNPPANQSKIV